MTPSRLLELMSNVVSFVSSPIHNGMGPVSWLKPRYSLVRLLKGSSSVGRFPVRLLKGRYSARNLFHEHLGKTLEEFFYAPIDVVSVQKFFQVT